ncbi:L-serine ammonia-lyase, iron-sulfur-dependent, subunit alpha [Staphylococcus argensis]|uniref:L-serine ammonia-lyase, iron-sulfur-dependent, subunit alpha n=1 Tax=Staphylococcus argensis TaxID=1607738 RepID=UPI002284068C|nr:L-serine ammonia-lyase, iron-sulfur-dependent, subunit alpha [Staphylococcus argensis]MCY6990280.1 L-serine ammonia-lyase, iron-sulfur-dependent, subunit alpha [Staphylococcus argensis]
MFKSIKELLAICEAESLAIHEVMMRQEMSVTGLTEEDVYARMDKNLQTMEHALEQGLTGGGVVSTTGLTGGDALLLQRYINSGASLAGETMLDVVSRAMATNEVNAAMGKICATPTAGSAGVVPGVLFGLRSKLNPSRRDMLNFLLTAGAFGFVVANNASISGSAGGCQAEVGSAAAMAAAATVELAGGSPQQSAEAFAICLKNMLGLVCDPVAGLVEVPCVKRNAAGSSNAVVSADMALAGIQSRIPTDEVIEAMFRIGQTMPSALRETGRGGLAGTPTGQRLKQQIFGD